MNFLFWNVKGKPLYKPVVNLAFHHEVDVLILVESNKIDPTTLLLKLNHFRNEYYFNPGIIENPNLKIFTRFSSKFIHDNYDDESRHVTIKYLEIPLHTPIILVIVHMRSKLYRSESSQHYAFDDLVREIVKVEERYKHTYTVLVGDLNMNPFETGIIAAKGLHAVMSMDVAKDAEREVDHKKYKFFYNPMWGLFGDATPGPPGTYYYSNSDYANYFWHMFDQVIIRPDLYERFDTKSLKILDFDGVNSLVTSSGRPNKRVASDHLPVFFSLDLELDIGD